MNWTLALPELVLGLCGLAILGVGVVQKRNAYYACSMAAIGAFLLTAVLVLGAAEGTGFGGVPLNMELKLEVWDSPNSAGVVIDAVRCCRIALDRKQGGPIGGPSSYFMKSPPQQFTDKEARTQTLAFIEGKN